VQAAAQIRKDAGLARRRRVEAIAFIGLSHFQLVQLIAEEVGYPLLSALGQSPADNIENRTHCHAGLLHNVFWLTLSSDNAIEGIYGRVVFCGRVFFFV